MKMQKEYYEKLLEHTDREEEIRREMIEETEDEDDFSM